MATTTQVAPKAIPGFTVPAGAYLPPELMELLPNIGTLAELKVLLVALHESTQPGRTGALLTFTELQQRAGLARASVAAGIRAAVGHGAISRLPFNRSFVYRLQLKKIGSNAEPTKCQSEPYVVIDTGTTLTDEQTQTVQELNRRGLSRNVAIQTVLRYKPQYIARHLAQLDQAIKKHLAKNPAGWLVTSLAEDWQMLVPPDEARRWWTDAEAKLIQH